MAASSVSSSPVKAVAQNEFDQQAIRPWRQANAYSKIAFPLWSQIEIEDREQKVLLLTQGVNGSDRPDPAVVLQAGADFWGDGVAELRIGGKFKALAGVFTFQAPFEDGIERDVPGTPLFIDDGPYLQGPRIRGERALLIADLG